MNDNERTKGQVIGFRQREEEPEPTGAFHIVDVWKCDCGGTEFNFSKQFGLVCMECDEAQYGWDR